MISNLDDSSDNFASGEALRRELLAVGFRPGCLAVVFRDVTARQPRALLRLFNDPFVASGNNIHNVTPFWLAPNGNCQDDLEVGDVIEGLPNGVFPITMNGTDLTTGRTKPCCSGLNSCLRRTPLTAPSSYPDETTLTALSPPQNFNCQ